VDERKEKILRRVLGWPVVWRWAANYIFNNVVDHVETEECLLCLARLRRLTFTHLPTIDYRRKTFCKKCGLPMSVWERKPKCTGKRNYVPPGPPPTPPVVIIPLNWGQ
jgi:hypothetical protein